jgi:hypothetical protein
VAEVIGCRWRRRATALDPPVAEAGWGRPRVQKEVGGCAGLEEAGDGGREGGLAERGPAEGGRGDGGSEVAVVARGV